MTYTCYTQHFPVDSLEIKNMDDLKMTDMLRRIKGVIMRDRVKSVDIRKELGVSSIQEKVREMRLCCYVHVQRMEENEVRAVGDMRVPGKRPRGRTRGRRMDGVRRDM